MNIHTWKILSRIFNTSCMYVAHGTRKQANIVRGKDFKLLFLIFPLVTCFVIMNVTSASVTLPKVFVYPECMHVKSPTLELPFDIFGFVNHTDYSISQFYRFAPAIGYRGNDYHWHLQFWCRQPEVVKEVYDLFYQWNNSTHWWNATESSGTYHQSYGVNDTHYYVQGNYYNYPLDETKVYFRPWFLQQRDNPIIDFMPEFYYSGSLGGAEISVNHTIRFGYNETFKPTKVLVPNIYEPYSFSNPASTQWLSMVNASNAGSFDDNYVAFYTGAVSDTVVLFSMAHKPVELAIRENTEATVDYIDFMRYMQNVTSAAYGQTNHGKHTFITVLEMNTTVPVATLKEQLSQWAHYSLARMTGVTDEITAWDGQYFTLNRTITFDDQAHDWSFTVPHYIPSPPHSMAVSPTSNDLTYNGTFAADFRYVNVTGGEDHRTFKLNANGQTIYHPAYQLDRVRDNVEFLKIGIASDGLWDGTSWRAYVGSACRNHAYNTDIHYGLLLYRNYTSDSSVDSCIKSSLNDRFNSVTYNMTIAHDLVPAYQIYSNQTYLDWAEDVANNANVTNGWDVCYQDKEIIMLADLYKETGNETYHDWAKARTSVALTKYIDASQCAHNTRGVGYYLYTIGDDISGTNITAWMINRMRDMWVGRSKYSGVFKAGGYRGAFYEIYSCHNDFTMSAVASLTRYFAANSMEVSPMYLSFLNELRGWFNNNICNATFSMIKSNGGIMRKIEYNSITDEIGVWEDDYDSHVMSYDQGNYLWAWMWYIDTVDKMIKNDIMPQSNLNFQYHTAKTVAVDMTYPYITFTNGSIPSWIPFQSNRLIFTVSNRTNAQTTTKVNCTTLGNPTSVEGSTSYSYNETTKIVSIYVTHSSDVDISVEVSWAIPVNVDIHPDRLNLKQQKGWVTAYISPPEGYTTDDIAVETVELEVKGASFPMHAACMHGIKSLKDNIFMAKFDKTDIVNYLHTIFPSNGRGFIEFKITGKLTDDTPFEGSNIIQLKF